MNTGYGNISRALIQVAEALYSEINKLFLSCIKFKKHLDLNILLSITCYFAVDKPLGDHRVTTLLRIHVAIAQRTLPLDGWIQMA